MGKRKQVAPKHADEAKRQQLQWNMAEEGTSSASISKVSQTDHTLQNEDINQPEGASSLSSSHHQANSEGASPATAQTTLHALCVDAFYQNLAFCPTALTLMSKDHAKTKWKEPGLLFGSLKVTLKPRLHLTPLPDQLPEFKECWLYVAAYGEDNPHMLYFETEDNNENVVQKKSRSRQSKFGVFWFASVNVPKEVIARLKTKYFWIECDYFDSQLKELHVTIYGSKDIITQPFHPSECISVKTPQIAAQRLMAFYYDVPHTHSDQVQSMGKALDFAEFYEKVMSIQMRWLSHDLTWEEEIASVRHNCLKPVLRPYQKKSVAWMLRQEKRNLIKDDERHKDMHPLYCEVKLRDGTVLYYNRFGGSFIKHRPEAIAPLPGGILADEMGLGKTVEILCCMLLHPRRDLEMPEPLPVIEDEEEEEESGRDLGGEEISNSSADTIIIQTETTASKESLKEGCDSAVNRAESANSLVDSPAQKDAKYSPQDRSQNNVSNGSIAKASLPGAGIKPSPHNIGEKGASTAIQTEASTSENPDRGKAAKRVAKKRRSRGTVEYVLVSEDNGQRGHKPVSRKHFFECNCGQLENEEETLRKGLHTVKCNTCGMSQHAECMHYDLRDPLRGDYLCPHCHSLSSKIKSGATLIISPQSICHQWIDEINKHIKECSIKVFIYTGVSKLGYIQPQTLAQQDIVITTYDVLRKEVAYANLPHTNSESGRRFRHPKRFLATPSPMVAVEWWRICLDEAQMVECVTTKTAEMAMRLKAVNRWCVTGTPLMRSEEDIYGLLLFLGLDPFMVQQWFKAYMYEPYCHGVCSPMYETLAKVLWRTAKKDVIDQIQLPARSEETYWLTFSPVEEHFYRRQYEVYQRSAHMIRGRMKQWQNSNDKLHTLDRKSLNDLLNPLFRLRQACCHPQIVRGAFLPLTKTMMSMEELLEHMTKKAKIECEEAHRQIVSSLNGMAGLAILKKRLVDAVDMYREVLRSVDEHKDGFRTDELQQLHAMHNLAFVLDQKPEGVAPTLRDESLREQCEDLKTKYMSKALVKVTAANDALKQSKAALGDIELNMTVANADDWWADVVEFAIQRGIGHELVDKIKDDLSRASRVEGSITNVLRSTDGLLFVVDSHLQGLKKARTALTTHLETLADNTSPELVNEAAMCCMRPVNKVLNICLFCKVDELFNEYESKLFLFVERGVTVTEDDSSIAYQVNTQRQGTRADSEVEKVLKSILAFYRLRFDTDEDLIKAANLQLKYFEASKKEFKRLRAVWLGHREKISATDELEMAIERLRFRQAHEPESTTKILNIIEVHEMRTNELKLKSDEIIGRNELRRKQGQLLYLKNLAKQSEEGRDHNPDLCPICQQELGVEWSVMLCGHCFCLECMRTLMDRNLIGIQHFQEHRLKCPLCRNTMSVREIAYVTTKKRDQVEVKGSHSTKVSAIVECLIKINRHDPTAKSLVFSTWISVLDILGSALTENNIPFRCLHESYNFQKNLSAFKEDQAIQVLLLPLHTGANGLNLVEANHVLFVEPQLNLEQEAQAVSRICRIGQTRQTKIHRFLVRATIEEKIHDMVKTLRASTSENAGDQESCELTVADITSLLEQPCPDEDEGNDDPVPSHEVNSTEASTSSTSHHPSQLGAGRIDENLPSTSSYDPGERANSVGTILNMDYESTPPLEHQSSDQILPSTSSNVLASTSQSSQNSPLLNSPAGDGNALDSHSAMETNSTTEREPSSHVESEPSSHAESEPSSHAESEPSSHAEREPSSHAESEPSSHVESEPSSHVESEPSSHAESEPSSHAESEPSSHAESEPSSHAESEPSSHAESEPSSHAEREPSSHAESEPSSHTEREPSSHTEREPSSHTEREPSSHVESEPSSHAESEPSSHAESEPSSHVESEPSSHVEREPSSHTEREPSSHVESEPSSHAESEPSSHAESEPSSHVESEPSSHVEREPSSHAANSDATNSHSPTTNNDSNNSDSFPVLASSKNETFSSTRLVSAHENSVPHVQNGSSSLTLTDSQQSDDVLIIDPSGCMIQSDSTEPSDNGILPDSHEV